MEEGGIKHVLYTDENGLPQVKMSGDNQADLKFWRKDGKLNFLAVMADDPDNPLTQISDGVYYESKEPS